MGTNDDDNGEKDDRTIFVGGLSEKVTEALLYELFYQAGPIDRVSIPKDKNFGFIEYKHLSTVDYALNLFNGTKLFGRDIFLKNRNANKNREREIRDHQQRGRDYSALTQGYNANAYLGADLSPAVPNLQQQQLLQQQLIMLATGQNLGLNALGVTPNTFEFASSRSDNAGSHREHYVERNRYHRDDNRNQRSNPYSRNRSRSPGDNNYNRSRDRSPVSTHRSSSSRYNDRGRNHQDDRSSSGYHRWGKR